MTYPNIDSLHNAIVAHHSSFGGDGGFGPISDVRRILSWLEGYINSSSCVGAGFEARADIPGCEQLHTFIQINKLDSGEWDLAECSYDAAVAYGYLS